MKRFAVILNIPSPYRVFLLECLNDKLKQKGIRLEVHFMARGHAGRPDSWLNPKMTFQYRYWKDYGRQFHHFNPGLIFHLFFQRPDWLLLGSPFDTFTGLFVGIGVTMHKANKGCWIEGNTKNTGKLNGPIGWLKRFVLSRCGFVAVPGQEGVGYIDLHRKFTKATLPRCVLLPNLIDESRFLPGRGSPGTGRVCIIPSRLSPEKGVLPFVKLLDRKMLEGWKIQILGRGEEERLVREMAQKGGFADQIEIIDYVPYDRMPSYYAAADLMLLPSLRDQNPLAVVEALHCGLPIALSDQAGNVEEGVTVGRNGWRLPVKNPVAFKAVLAEIFATPKERLREMGECSKWENATFWDTRKAVSDFVQKVLV